MVVKLAAKFLRCRSAHKIDCDRSPVLPVGRRPILGLTVLLLLAQVGHAQQNLPPAAPATQGMQAERLTALTGWIETEQHAIRSVLVVRNGRLVHEWYAAGITRQSNHNIYSVTKSVVATLAGIAIERKDLPPVETSLARLLPAEELPVNQPYWTQATLADLLTMQSGLPSARANRPRGPARVLFNRLHNAPDRTAAILALKPVRPPGETFVYGNAEPQLVVSLLQRHTGRRAIEFARKELFEPLGFENDQWRFADQRGVVAGGYGLRLRAIDLAKLGQLYLQRGRWGEKQILPAAWVQAATRDHTGTGYGYYWWIDREAPAAANFSARGVRGQRIAVFPRHNLVLVVTANLPPEKTNPVLATLTNDYILRAITNNN